MIVFNKEDCEKEVALKNTQYKIYILGGFEVSNIDRLKVTISNADNTSVEIKKLKFRERTFIDGEKSVLIANFSIEKSDNYKIKVENLNEILVHKSRLFLFNIFFSSMITDFKLVIK